MDSERATHQIPRAMRASAVMTRATIFHSQTPCTRARIRVARKTAARRSVSLFGTAATAVFRGESGALCSYSQNILANSTLGTCVYSSCRLRALHFSGPQPDTEEEGSALDFPEVRPLFPFLKVSAPFPDDPIVLRFISFIKPQEYVRAVPSRRPDVFPDLKEPKQPLPKPMPGDPEVPDEEEEEEERKKNPGEPGTDPDEDEDENPKREKKEEGEED